jgi:anaerobic dimethyl sulfoxide reductase subunit B
MSEKQFGFVFVKEDCIQCHGCQVACKSWRNLELGVIWRRVLNIWVGAFPTVSCMSASVSCMHCVEPSCMAVCPVDAISKRPDGIVMVDREACTGCQACAEACPFDVPRFGTDDKMQKCDMCVGERNVGAEDPPCVMTCPTGAIGIRLMDASEKLAAEKAMKALVDAA